MFTDDASKLAVLTKYGRSQRTEGTGVSRTDQEGSRRLSVVSCELSQDVDGKWSFEEVCVHILQ